MKLLGRFAIALASGFGLLGCGGGGLSQFEGLGVSRPLVKVARGETQDVTVAVHRVPGEADSTVTTFSATGLPSGVTASFQPTTLTLVGTDDQSVVMHLTADRGAGPIQVPITVRRTANGQTYDKSLKVNVVDFAVGTSLDVNSLKLAPGDAKDIVISLSRRGSSNGTAEITLGGKLPDGVTYSFDLDRVQITSDHPLARVRLTLTAATDATSSAEEKCHVASLKGTNEDDSENIDVKLEVPTPELRKPAHRRW